MASRRNRKQQRKASRAQAQQNPKSSSPLVAQILEQMGFSALNRRGEPRNDDDSSVDYLRSLLSAERDDDDDDDDDDNYGWNDLTDLNSVDVIEEWREALKSCMASHSPTCRQRARNLRGTLKLSEVVPGAGCTVSLRLAEATVEGTWRCDLDDYTYSLDCSCSHSRVCEHTYFIANSLNRMLMDPASELVKKIRGVAPREQPLDRTYTLLEQLARNAQRELQIPSVEPASETPLTRFVWNADISHYDQKVTMRPIIQQEKKTGGWTKGRESNLDAFLNSSRDEWSPIDRQLASLVRRESWQSPSIRIVDALRALAGSDRFQVDRETFELSVRPLEIIVREVEDGLQLSTSATDVCLAQTNEPAAILADAGHGVLTVLPAARQAIYFSGPQHSYEICKDLLQHREPIPVAHRDRLLSQLEPLRHCMSVRLPESIAGVEVPADMQPVLLLLLRRNGSLDATMQMRDHHQRLLNPGEGMARLHETVDGKPVQLIRDLQHEVRITDELSAELNVRRGVPLSRCGWKLTDPDDINALLAAAGSLVQQNRLTVLWHQDSVGRFDVIGRVSARNVRVEVSRQRDWFGLNGTCTVGDLEIPLKELLQGMQGKSMNGLLEIAPGKWAAVAEELRQALQRLSDVSMESRGRLQLDASAAPVVSALEAARVAVEADRHWEKCLTRLREATDTEYEPPAGLTAQLRDYQLQGFQWLCRLSHWGIGGILADDMGLGKTIQALALLLTRAENGPALVIAPTSLGFNWQRECERFTPALNPIVFRNIDRAELKNHVADGDLVICSYGLALREADLLKEIHWGTLILDEAQNIKNSNSKTAAQIRSLQADWKIALTGTPMENHLGELWSIFHTVAPGVLGSWEQFRRRFALPIEKSGDADRRAALAQVIAPFVLRRSKREVLKDLPERTETNLLVDLSPEERLRYDQMRLAAVSELDELGDDSLSHDQRFRVLQMLTRLRQLSCHIGMVDDSWKGSSSKLTVLMEQLEQLKERGSRPLIFSQFTSHLALIREACDAAGITYQYLDGQTTPAQRQQRVEAFQSGESDAFLISLKAGGTGLNLTAADYVIHMDPWWNPAVEDQATDRAHRIGQTQSVMVYRIIARDTIEEQILQLHDQKRDLVDGVLSGADAAAKLSTRELAELIRGGIELPVAGI